MLEVFDDESSSRGAVIINEEVKTKLRDHSCLVFVLLLHIFVYKWNISSFSWSQFTWLESFPPSLKIILTAGRSQQSGASQDKPGTLQLSRPIMWLSGWRMTVQLHNEAREVWITARNSEKGKKRLFNSVLDVNCQKRTQCTVVNLDNFFFRDCIHHQMRVKYKA